MSRPFRPALKMLRRQYPATPTTSSYPVRPTPADLVAEVEGSVAHAGAATNPDGGTDAGPALPGSSHEFEVIGAPGEYLSLASMFVQSNDWFVALRDVGFYDEGGAAVSGDSTDLLAVYDADAEIRPVELELSGYLALTIEPVG